MQKFFRYDFRLVIETFVWLFSLLNITLYVRNKTFHQRQLISEKNIYLYLLFIFYALNTNFYQIDTGKAENSKNLLNDWNFSNFINICIILLRKCSITLIWVGVLGISFEVKAEGMEGVGGGVKITLLCLKFVRIMLETWKLVPKCIHM